MLRISHYGLALSLCLGLMAPAYADPSPLVSAEPVKVESVQVVASRSAIAVPYQQAYEVAHKVQQATAGRIMLGMRLVPARTDVNMDRLQLQISSENEDLDIPLQQGRFFVIPVIERLAKDKGHFYLNRKSGEMGVHLMLIPTDGPEGWTMRRVQQAVADGNLALRAFLPWYARPFIADADAIGACSPIAGRSIALQEGGKVTLNLKADEQHTGRFGQTLHCARVRGDEVQSRDAKLMLPDDGEIVLLAAPPRVRDRG